MRTPNHALRRTAARVMRTELLFLLLSVTFAVAEPPKKAPETLVADFEAGHFLPGPVNRTGWTMEAAGGREYHRADLNRQAEELAAHGVAAFSSAFALLDHREGYMRYIGVKTLESITDIHPTWFYFAAPGEPGRDANQSLAWADDAKRVWKAWYEKHRK